MSWLLAVSAFVWLLLCPTLGWSQYTDWVPHPGIGACPTGQAWTRGNWNAPPTCATVSSLAPAPYDITVFFQGLPPASGAGSYAYIAMSGSFTLPANCGAINSHQSEDIAITASTGSPVVTLKKLHSGATSTVGTVTFAASATGTCATTGGTAQSFVAGDLFEVIAPNPQDATLADVSITTTFQRLP